MRIAVCDDEEVFRDKITEYLQPYMDKNPEITKYEFSSGEDLMAAYDWGDRFDLIFLDVEMKGLSGVEAGRKIRDLDSIAMFVFVTSHVEYVPDAFVLNAFQFLVKPVKQELFNREFDRALKTYTKMKYKYKINVKNKPTILEVKDILYIETYGRNLKAVTLKNSYEFVGNITAEEKKLAEYGFIRCHQGYLVNMHYIFKPEHLMLELTNKQTIPVGKRYKNDVMEKLNKFISGCCI